MGGTPSQAWINGNLQLRVVGHEMGHNFGLYHSHSLSCDTGGCAASEYGDGWDDMGAAVGHYNAFQKERLGWLNAGASPPITTVTAEGTYGLEPYEPDSFNSKALKILKSTDPVTLKNTYYYVEYRTSFGFDSAVASGLLVHTGSESSANSSYLWDLAPSTTTSDWVLDVGQSYADATAGVTLTTLSASSTGATVQVTFGVAPCAGADPTVALAPAGTQYSAAGATVSSTATVTDNDSAQCAAATFALQATVPAGWTATWASATLTLSPGASAVTTLTLTSAPTANGLYTVPVTAANDSYVGTTAAVVSVSSPCVAANPTVALSPTSQSTVPGGAVDYTVTVADNDSANCPVATFTLQATEPAGWTAAFASTTLPLSPGASGVTTLTVTSPSSATAGLYTIAVTAAHSGTPTYAALASVTAEVVTSLTVSVKTNKASYTPGQSVTMTAVVYANGSPAANAIVTFAITKPDGAVVQKTATTDSTGTTVYRLRLKQTDPLGTYQVTTHAAAYGISGSATASFMVQ